MIVPWVDLVYFTPHVFLMCYRNLVEMIGLQSVWLICSPIKILPMASLDWPMSPTLTGIPKGAYVVKVRDRSLFKIKWCSNWKK